MAHPHTVLRSIEAPGGLLCVDLFRRPDGSYGFEECRRDPEDGRGWSVVGHHGARVFATGMAALAAANETVAWLVEID